MVDPHIVEQKLHHLELYLQHLEKYKDITSTELEENLDLSWIVEHGLQLCIQIILDIGNHILAEEGIAVDEYSDIFKELAKMAVLPEEFARNISGMAGFRNILVHEYARVNKEKVADVLKHHLEDFRTFARYIVKYLDAR
ncbi:MAG: type VII toxin-antitoxin system HepT family RNase toxin [Moorellaceae bacterium]